LPDTLLLPPPCSEARHNLLSFLPLAGIVRTLSSTAPMPQFRQNTMKQRHACRLGKRKTPFEKQTSFRQSKAQDRLQKQK
jgi:hypothetical protein